MPIKKLSNKGTLQIVCGSMFSGKSEELIRRLRRAQIAKQNVIIFKPSIDNRNSIEHIVSHNGNKLKAYPIDNIEILLELVTPEIDVIGVDEVQFFPNEIVETILKLVDMGKNVVAAGLDMDFRGVPFFCMPALLAVADEVTKLKAICMQCCAEAHFTQRLINGIPAKFDDPIVLVGAEECYEARCRACFEINKNNIIIPMINEQKQNSI